MLLTPEQTPCNGLPKAAESTVAVINFALQAFVFFLLAVSLESVHPVT